jgi:hypothetical protein
MGIKENLAQALREFSPYFGLKTTSDLVNAVQLEQVSGATNQGAADPRDTLRPSRVAGSVIDFLIDTSTGALTTPDIIRGINALTGRDSADNGQSVYDEINQRLKVYFSSSDNFRITGAQETAGLETFLTSQGMNQNPSSPTKDQPTMSVFQIFDSRISPYVKNGTALTMFMNFLPNIELQRCTPFLDIQFIAPSSPLDGTGKLRTLSLNKFLLGAQNIRSEGVLHDLAFANTVEGRDSDRNPASFTDSGMELFTAPQTLQNISDINNFDPSLRSVPIRDPFRPFMSIESLNIDVVSQSSGLASFKTAKLAIILHDSSRLAEISEMVKPDLYGKSEVLIEYGWQHPDADLPVRQNPYGALIHGMRCKEKYSIYNSSFAFDEVGQVKITLQMAMLCASDLSTQNIASSERVIRAQETVERISRTIGAIRTELRAHQYPGAQEIRGSQVLDAAEDVRHQFRFSQELKTSLRELQASVRGNRNQNLSRLATQIQNLYMPRTGPSAVNRLQNSIADEINVKISSMQGSRDPFELDLLASPEAIAAYRRNATLPRPERAGSADPVQTADITSPGNRVSLARLLLEFVGIPLIQTKKYDDIQWIFHKFNAHASDAAKKNIGSFTVDVNWFKEQFLNIRMQNIGRSANLTLAEFIAFIGTGIVHDYAAIDYGLSTVYRHARTPEGAPIVNPVNGRNNTAIDGSEIQSRTDTIMRSKNPDGIFKMPEIDMFIETLSGASLPGGDNARADSPRSPNNKTILKIHIFDRQCSPYETYGALLAASRDNTVASIGRMANSLGPSTAEQNHLQLQQAILGAARQSGIIRETVAGSKIYRIEKTHQDLKNFVMETVPFIIYGAQGSAVKTASVQTQQDSQLASVNMLRSSHSGPPLANGEDVGGLPLRVYPTELNLSCFGCPVIDFGQQLFMDFNTGTTIDNLYGVTGISHTFSPGKFETSAKLTPLDAYGQYASLQGIIDNATAAINAPSSNSGRPTS